MIRVENLEKYYDRHKKNEKHVLQEINLELPSKQSRPLMHLKRVVFPQPLSPTTAIW